MLKMLLFKTNSTKLLEILPTPKETTKMPLEKLPCGEINTDNLKLTKPTN
jgi:hypothetical protein